jgi:uncharacterized protein YlaI
MKCPTCDGIVHPHMNSTPIGKNAKNNNIFIFYQICPECREPIIGIKEALKGEIYLNPNDLDGLIVMTKKEGKSKADYTSDDT